MGSEHLFPVLDTVKQALCICEQGDNALNPREPYVGSSPNALARHINQHRVVPKDSFFGSQGMANQNATKGDNTELEGVGIPFKE